MKKRKKKEGKRTEGRFYTSAVNKGEQEAVPKENERLHRGKGVCFAKAPKKL